MHAERTLNDRGIAPPELPRCIGTHASYKQVGGLVWISGQGLRKPEGSFVTGKVGQDHSVDDGYGQARLVGLDLPAMAQDVAGTLGKVETVKSVDLVNAVPELAGHGKVIDGCSDLLVEALGERDRHARPSCGMNSPPGQVTVEIEAGLRASS